MFYVQCVSERKKRPQKEEFDVVLHDDFKDFVNFIDIPEKAVYVSGGLAVEVKKFHKRFYVCFSKSNVETDRKKFINVPISDVGAVQKALAIIDKHIKKYV